MTPIWMHRDTTPGPHAAVKGFLEARIWGDGREIEAATIMAVADGGQIVAAVGFHNYDPHAGVVEISAASDTKRWLTRPILFEMFNFPFGQLGCQAVFARLDPENTKLRRIFRAYGFTETIVPRMRGAHKDEVVCVLTVEDWRENGFHKEA